MRSRRATGRPCRLTADQVDAIRRMYQEGAAAMVSRTIAGQPDAWLKRSSGSFGIRYDQDHVGRLMHKFGLRQRRFVYAPSYAPLAAAAASLPLNARALIRYQAVICDGADFHPRRRTICAARINRGCYPSLLLS